MTHRKLLLQQIAACSLPGWLNASFWVLDIHIIAYSFDSLQPTQLPAASRDVRFV